MNSTNIRDEQCKSHWIHWCIFSMIKSGTSSTWGRRPFRPECTCNEIWKSETGPGKLILFLRFSFIQMKRLVIFPNRIDESLSLRRGNNISCSILDLLALNLLPWLSSKTNSVHLVEATCIFWCWKDSFLKKRERDSDIFFLHLTFHLQPKTRKGT